MITCPTHGTQKTAQVAAAKRAVEEGGGEEVYHCLILLRILNNCAMQISTIARHGHVDKNRSNTPRTIYGY